MLSRPGRPASPPRPPLPQGHARVLAAVGRPRRDAGGRRGRHGPGAARAARRDIGARPRAVGPRRLPPPRPAAHPRRRAPLRGPGRVAHRAASAGRRALPRLDAPAARGRVAAAARAATCADGATLRGGRGGDPQLPHHRQAAARRAAGAVAPRCALLERAADGNPGAHRLDRPGWCAPARPAPALWHD